MRIVSPSLKLDVEDSIAGSEWISPGGELAGAASRTRTICPVRGRREGPAQGHRARAGREAPWHATCSPCSCRERNRSWGTEALGEERRMRTPWRALPIKATLLCLGLVGPAGAVEGPPPGAPGNLVDLSLEDLMNLRVERVVS